MIPQKIHYCWLSNDPLPDKLRQCVDSWEKYLPDYEIVKWDLRRFPLEKNIWVRQAFERGKYAFAADYIRLYALAKEGGIYFDSDVEVLKPFDDLLDLPYFVCTENGTDRFEAAVLGAEKGTPWLLKCLEYYKNREFVDKDGHEDTLVLPLVLKRTVEAEFKIEYIESPLEFGNSQTSVYVLPFDYFSPKSYVTKKMQITTNTYSIHHFAGSWIPWWYKVAQNIWLALKCVFQGRRRK